MREIKSYSESATPLKGVADFRNENTASSFE
jgi:hypothetical protein